METSNGRTYTITGGPFKPHEYVVIKREMNAVDEATIQNASAKMGGTKKSPKVELTVGDIKLAALKRMIVKWQIDKVVESPDGQETIISPPLNDEEIEQLPRRKSAYINKVIDELNPEDDNDDFLLGVNGQSGGN